MVAHGLRRITEQFQAKLTAVQKAVLDNKDPIIAKLHAALVAAQHASLAASCSPPSRPTRSEAAHARSPFSSTTPKWTRRCSTSRAILQGSAAHPHQRWLVIIEARKEDRRDDVFPASSGRRAKSRTRSRPLAFDESSQGSKSSSRPTTTHASTKIPPSCVSFRRLKRHTAIRSQRNTIVSLLQRISIVVARRSTTRIMRHAVWNPRSVIPNTPYAFSRASASSQIAELQ